MPYQHAGEIGDVWKHLPLCDVLEIETPKRYYETNAAFAEYELPKSIQKQYGVFNLFKQANHEILHNSTYIKILERIDLQNEHKYYGSPALAMTVLSENDVSFYFHDIEKEPLNEIENFSEHSNLQNKVITLCGDSISVFLKDIYFFNQNDFIFIDPYTPFNNNELGNNFFDVFNKAYKSQAKVMLWYGYDNLDDKNRIIQKLQALSYEFSKTPIHTFDVWQKCMNNDSCKINPGVPGCGLAVANLSKDSTQRIDDYLYFINDLYSNATYDGEYASLCVGHLIL
jgi:23S rRNA (adenine2030-N6)-methyltransferase